jgi:glycosyltransferase involved in cell wall biosynthesis
MDSSIPVTVIILTHNEALNIGPCVESLSAFGEIIVLDSGSTDGTIDILRSRFPRVRVLEHPFQDFGQQRNWALDHASPANAWVLFFDADERCTPACARAIEAAVANPGDRIGFFMCYRNMFLGRWIKRCTMYPTWQLRLLMNGRVRYVKEGHGQREVLDGQAGYIEVPYEHLGFSKGIRQWIARHNEYSSNEVELLQALAGAPLRIGEVFALDRIRRRRALKRLGAHVPLRPFVRFVYLYFIRLGCLDGRPGLLYCYLRVAQELHILVKQAELEANRPVTTPASALAGVAVDTGSFQAVPKRRGAAASHHS